MENLRTDFQILFVEDRLLGMKDMPSQSQRLKKSRSGRQGKQDQHEQRKQVVQSKGDPMPLVYAVRSWAKLKCYQEPDYT